MRDSNCIAIQTTVKQLTPLWRIAIFEQQLGTHKDVVDEIINAASSHCKKEATILAQCLDFNDRNQDWAKSFFASHIAELIADSWAEHRTECLSFSYSEYLAGLATPDLYAGLPPSWENTSAEVSYIATCVNAMSKAVGAYSKFNLFHFDQDKIIRFFNNTILSEAQNCIETILSVLPESAKNSDSVSSLYQSFIKTAGVAMSDLWLAESAIFINAYQAADDDSKKLLQKNGGDLKKISASFSKAMQEITKHSLQGLELIHSSNLSLN